MRNTPRLQGETPRRYGGRLAGRPGFDGGLVQTITGAYDEARYGDEPPSEQTASAAAEAWQEMVSDLTPDQPDEES